MTHVYRDKVTPTRIIIPTDILRKTDEWAAKCIEVSVAGSDGRLICRSTYIPIDTLDRHYRKEKL